jgi:hypothetical protein
MTAADREYLTASFRAVIRDPQSAVADPADYEYFMVALRNQPEDVLRPLSETGAPGARVAALMILDQRKAEFRKTSSKKRGRPRLLSGAYAEVVNSIAEQTTDRGKQNHYYYMRALAMLPNDDPRFAWLYQGHKVRAVILSELGRLSDVCDEETALGFALEICKAKMTTRKAVRALRNVRGVRKPADDTGAALAIRTTVNNYLKAHPDFTLKQMRDALRIVLGAVEELCAE